MGFVLLDYELSSGLRTMRTSKRGGSRSSSRYHDAIPDWRTQRLQPSGLSGEWSVRWSGIDVNALSWIFNSVAYLCSVGRWKLMGLWIRLDCLWLPSLEYKSGDWALLAMQADA